MEEIQVVKLVFGILLGLGFLVLSSLTYFLGYKKWFVSEEKCTEKTVGTVVGYTLASRAKNFPIHLPVVEYKVNGKKYKVIGPKYRYVVSRVKTGLLNKNEYKEFDPKEQVLRIDAIRNSAMSIQVNPFALYFPKGGDMDVFYNPKRPREAYAYRYCNEKFKFYILLAGAMFIFALLVYVEIIL